MKINAVIQWELTIPENETNIATIARDVLESILPKNFGIQILKTNHKIKSKLETLGEFTLEEVFSKLSKNSDKIEFKVENESYLVRMNSHRYFVFKENSKCVACGLAGVKFVLEKHPNDKTPHFNLYAIENDELVLMTKDHVLAKSKGGLNKSDNYQTTCCLCNNLKADCHLSYEQVKVLRNLWDENRHIPRKQLSKLIQETRHNLLFPK